MRIEIGDKYLIETSTHDFILSEKKISKSEKTPGKEIISRLGYYSKMDQLIRALIMHDVKQADVQSLQAMEQHISRVSLQCEQAFKESANV